MAQPKYVPDAPLVVTFCCIEPYCTFTSVAEDDYFVLAKQHCVAALQQLKLEAQDSAETPLFWMQTVKVNVLKPSTPINIRMLCAGRGQAVDQSSQKPAISEFADNLLICLKNNPKEVRGKTKTMETDKQWVNRVGPIAAIVSAWADKEKPKKSETVCTHYV